jgi:hypothetical protein
MSEPTWCRRCRCPDCLEIQAQVEAAEAVEAAKNRERANKLRAERAEKQARRDTTTAQASVIWLLVNQCARSSFEAKGVHELIAEALDLRVNMVSARRIDFEREMYKRARDEGERLTGLRLTIDQPTWAKIPGTVGTDMPPESWPITREHERGRR